VSNSTCRCTARQRRKGVVINDAHMLMIDESVPKIPKGTLVVSTLVEMTDAG
jgi:hypothetical protein